MIGNYDDRAESIVKQAHRQDGSAKIHYPDGSSESIVLRDPTITLSEDWAPYLQMSGESVAPEAAADLAKIDPRTGAALEVLAGYVYGDMTVDVHRIGYGHMRVRDAVFPARSMTITAASAEQLCQDSKWLPPTETKTFSGVLEALQFLAGYALGVADVPFVSTVTAGYRPDLVSGVVLEQGDEIWPVMSAIALSAELRVWADETGEWRLAPKTSIAGITAGYLREGPTTTIREVRDTLSRDNWFDAVALIYTWKDSGGVDRKIVGTYAPAPLPGLRSGAGRKTFKDERSGPISQYQADANAKTTANNLSTRGGSYTVESAAMYWLRPGDTIQLDMSNGTSVRHIIRKIVFTPAAGTMTVTTREPSNLDGA